MILPDGTWVLGPGDSSDEIRKIKAFLRAKFASYAGHLADTGLYDQELYLVVQEVQRRYGLPVTGFIGYSLKIKMGYLQPPPPVRPQLHTVCGTGVRGDFGPDADCGRWLQDNGLCNWWWVGYEAKPFPMWGSILGGVNQLITDISQRSQPGTPLWGIGYSQGAIVWSLLYKYHMVPTDGILHNRLPDLQKAWMFENPMREENSNGGNILAGRAPLDGAGALVDRMVDTPGFWKESVNPNDIYAQVPTTPGWGENVRAICKIVMGNDWYAGQDNIFEQLLEIGISPFTEGWAAFQAVIKAGMFFGSGTGPHVQNLPVGPAIDYFRAA